MTRSLTALAILSFAVPAVAQETRQLDAHEHGVSTAEIAIEDDLLVIDLHAPGMDIVGFEYAAEAEEDRAAVANAVMQLTRADEIVTVDEAAGCLLTEVLSHLHGEEHEHGETDAHMEGDEHGDEHDDEHGDEHGDERDDAYGHARDGAGAGHQGAHDPSALDSTIVDEPHWLDDDTFFQSSTRVSPAPDDRDGAQPDDSFGEPLDESLEEPYRPPVEAAPGAPANASSGDDTRSEAPRSAEAIRDPMADARERDALLAIRSAAAGADDQDEPLVELSGSGPVWALYENEAGSIDKVRRGISWGALLVTLPWLLWRGLIGTALVYALLWIVSLGGLAVTALAWSEAGPAAPVLLIALCAGFAAIALTGLIVLPFLRANRWRETAKQRRGHLLRGEVRARSGDEALSRLRAHVSGTRMDHRRNGPTGIEAAR